MRIFAESVCDSIMTFSKSLLPSVSFLGNTVKAQNSEDPDAGSGVGWGRPAGPLELQGTRWVSTSGGSVAGKMFSEVQQLLTWEASCFEMPGEWSFNLLG